MLGASPPLPSAPDDSSSENFVAQSAVHTQLAARPASPLAHGDVVSTSTIRDCNGFFGENEITPESRGLGIVTSSPKIAQQGSQSAQKDRVSP